MTGPSLKPKLKRAAFMQANPQVRGWTLLHDVDCWHVLCRCRCGCEALVKWSSIWDTQGSTQCKECAKAAFIERTKASARFSPEERRLLNIAHGQKERCTNPSNLAWKNYGGRGITFEFESPKAAAQYMLTLGPRPTPRHSIDRIDNDKGYAAGNLRWASRREQKLNSRPTLNNPRPPKLTPDEKREQFIEHNPRIGRWTLVQDLGSHHCRCRCECGTEKSVAWSSLKSGVSTGCASCSGKYGRKL
jgi:hypothetical protein